jgi:N utilization substance protein B
MRRQAREAALQILYLADVAHLAPDVATRSLWAGLELLPKAKTFADELAKGALAERPALDALITKYAANWEIPRMAAIDRNLLRLAAYELLHKPETPVSVVIDEAVEIAKIYSTQDSSKFVNGLLDKIKTERPPTGELPLVIDEDDDEDETPSKEAST